MGRLKLPLLSLVYLMNTWAFASVSYECNTQGVPLFSEGKFLTFHDDTVEWTFNDRRNGIPDVFVGEEGEYKITHNPQSIGVYKKGQESYLLYRVFPTTERADLRMDLNHDGNRVQVRCLIQANKKTLGAF